MTRSERMDFDDSTRPPNGAGHAGMYELRCGDLTQFVTSCPPISVEWGIGWWVRIEDNWIQLRKREYGEQMSPALEQELCGLVSKIFKHPN
jgi:hypothetical protein